MVSGGKCCQVSVAGTEGPHANDHYYDCDYERPTVFMPLLVSACLVMFLCIACFEDCFYQFIVIGQS